MNKYNDLFSYCDPYLDPSAGTELTLTIPVQRVAVLPDLVEVYCDTCKFFGNDPATDDRCIERAGIHMCFLWSMCYSSEQKYSGEEQLPIRELDNFHENVQKLSLALLFLGSADDKTRSLDFRSPMIRGGQSDVDRGQIDDHGRTCLEFRTFDPCYRHPHLILDNFLYMARTLDFFQDPPGERVELEDFSPSHTVGGPFDFWGRRPLEKVFASPEIRQRLLLELDYFSRGPFATRRARDARKTISGWPEPE
jgi:hypothetical protein